VVTDWNNVPVFGDPVHVRTVRPSAYGIICDGRGRLAVVRTPLGLFLPGGGSMEDEPPEATVARETFEECGLAVEVGPWRRTAIEHVFSPAEQAQFEKRSTFCNAVVTGREEAPSEPDHALEWISFAEAEGLLTPPSHRWAATEWQATSGLSGGVPGNGTAD